MLLETDLIPFGVNMPVGERVIVFAPHPDDETLGMGGSLRILSDLGKKIKVVVLTRGEKAEPDATKQDRHAEMRQKEALKAFKILGLTDYEFLGFPDREIFSNMDAVAKAMKTIVDDFNPDVLYSPSIVEIHPDHRAAAELSLSLCKDNPHIECLFYEITVPVRPSLLVDVTKVFKYKKKAVKCYKSQLRITDYLRLAEALNIYRSFTLGKGVKFAEAFWQVHQVTGREALRNWMTYDVPLPELKDLIDGRIC
jgi:N-acetylglucosamine malate deacetylase 1